MVDIIKETLPNGEEYEFDIDLSADKAMEMLKKLYELEGTVDKFDYTSAVFSLFVSSIHTLKHSGWTNKELINEVLDHSEIADKDINNGN